MADRESQLPYFCIGHETGQTFPEKVLTELLSVSPATIGAPAAGVTTAPRRMASTTSAAGTPASTTRCGTWSAIPAAVTAARGGSRSTIPTVWCRPRDTISATIATSRCRLRTAISTAIPGVTAGWTRTCTTRRDNGLPHIELRPRCFAPPTPIRRLTPIPGIALH